MRIIITGGGTLGHIYPALAIADKLRQKANILFIGTSKGIESEVIQKEGVQFRGVDVQGWTGKTKVKFIIKLIKAFFLGIKYIREFKPDIVVGMGGYASVPVVLGAVLLRIKTLVHEQNSIPGKANRLLAKFVDKVAVNFAESQKYLPIKKVVVTGNPIRAQFGQINRQEALLKFNLDTDKLTLLIFGGSRGAHRINEVMKEIIGFLPTKVQLIWATGEQDYQFIKEAVLKTGLKIVVEKFFYDLPIAYQLADLVVCRAGATTLAEIIACNLPAILIPYPYATSNHQEHNAKLLVEKGAAVMIKESELSAEKLTNAIIELIENRDKLKNMAQKYQSFKITDATQNVIDVICSLVESGE